MRNNLLAFLVLLFVVTLFTNGIFGSYFEQDEWGGIGGAIFRHDAEWWNYLISKGVHFSPLTSVYWELFFSLFGFQAQYYIFLQLLFHSLASFSVFVLSKKLTKDFRISFLSALLFATNAAASQAFTHLAVVGMVAVFIFVMAFFVYLSRITTKKISIKNSLILFGLFLGAVFFREEGLLVVPLSIAYVLLIDKKKISKVNIKPFLLFGVGLVGFIILRVISQLFNVNEIVSGSQPASREILYNLVTLPIKLVVQNIVESSTLANFLAEKAPEVYQEANLNYFEAQPVLIDLSNLIIFNFIVIIFVSCYLILRKKIDLNIVTFAIVWILANSVILAFAGRSLYQLEPRYLYFSSFPVFLVISVFLFSLFKIRLQNTLVHFMKNIVLVLVPIIMMVNSYDLIQSSVEKKAFQGEIRRRIINDIVSAYPVIPSKVVFYVKCDKECYRNSEIGLPNEVVLPFSSGAGWIILVNYASQNKNVYANFLTSYEGETILWNWSKGKFEKFDNKLFLWDTGAQGYREINGYGFGYFTDFELLRNVVRKHNLRDDAIIAFEYEEKNFKMIDISSAIREELKGE